ncbi:MAG: DUF371 domain-containing protein [Candidatus Bathycorpusculaceae bacterium]
MKATEIVNAFGHKNIRAAHKTTLEITKEKKLSLRGDCVIAVSADKGFPELNPEFKRFLLMEGAKLTILIEAAGVTDTVHAFGGPKLVLTHPTDLVVRKSGYVCSRTLAIYADKAASTISRRLVEKLRNPKQKVKITLRVEV